jgi:hypothetical protein
MQNKRGQVVIYSICVALVIIILALALAKPLNDSVQSARNETSGDILGLNCSSTDNNFIRGTCVAVDISPFWYISSLILIGGGFLVSRVIIS